MNPFKNVWYSLKYDYTHNFWIYKNRFSHCHGITLMFHHVTDEYVDINDSCKCGIEQFRGIIQSYIDENYEFVTIERALRYIKEKKETKYVLVTFDDIPDNVYTNAYPILKSLNIPFVVFITVDFIDQNQYITKSHLEQLCAEPLCTIGAHTMTHPMLKESFNYEWEIEQSKKELELLTNKNIKYFAYPFGQYSSVSKDVRKKVKNSGFDCAFCTISSPMNETSTKDLFFLPRFSPTPTEKSINKFSFTLLKSLLSLVKWPIKHILRYKK